METIEQFGSIAALARSSCEIDALAAGRAASETWWIRAWSRGSGADTEPMPLGVRYDGRLVGFAPLGIRRSGGAQRLVGLGVRGTVADRVGLVAAPGHEVLAAEMVAQELARRSGDWDTMRLTSLPNAALTTRALISALGSAGLEPRTVATDDVWELNLPDTWDELLGRLSKSHRKQLRRMDRSMVESGRAALVTATTDREVEESLEVLIDLHQRRWRSVGRVGSFEVPAFRRFVLNAVECARPAGRLRLHVLNLDGRPAAAELDFGSSAGICAYQTGFDPDLADERVGELLLMETLKTAIADGSPRFDFGFGTEPYKPHWRAEPSPSVDLIASAPRPGARTMAAIGAGSTAARRSDRVERLKHGDTVRRARTELRSLRSVSFGRG